MQGGVTDATREKKGYAKIEQTCRLAAKDEIGYCWVDTCCIDKSSSAELTESINSMYIGISAQKYATLSCRNTSRELRTKSGFLDAGGLLVAGLFRS